MSGRRSGLKQEQTSFLLLTLAYVQTFKSQEEKFLQKTPGITFLLVETEILKQPWATFSQEQENGSRFYWNMSG